MKLLNNSYSVTENDICSNQLLLEVPTVIEETLRLCISGNYMEFCLLRVCYVFFKQVR